VEPASVDEIVAQIPVGQLAAQLGIDEESADQAVRSAVPALLGGLAANAQDPGGAASLQTALAQHANAQIDSVDFSSIDVADGDKIVHHIYGDNTDEVVSRLGGLGGDGSGGGGLMKTLLPLLAPLVMGWLAKRGAGAGQTASSPEEGAGDLGGMLDSLSGGASGGGGLGDLLGGLLGGGGGDSSSGGPDIGDLLGGLLGGGTKG